MVLSAALSDMEIEFVDGIQGEMVAEVGLPPGGGGELA